ncbi:MAG TPA: amidohydrolase [Steroidobacteraceae bacterium]|nr:amidohydrolase [Steroidobacteraceae bacterium]
MPAHVALIASLVIAMIAGAGEPPADLVLLHGKIHTQDARRSVVQALALRGNTIVAAGTDQAVSALKGPKTQTIDLAGRTVLPGIIDAHTHPAESAQDAGKCSLEDKSLTPAEIKARVAVCLKDNPGDPHAWFEVIQAVTAGLTLSRHDLDAMLRDRPMILSGSDGHTAWVNSAALKAAHISAATRDPFAGRIERDAAGNPTGTLRDAAINMAWAAKPVARLDQAAALLDKAFTAMRATGITSVQDADVGDRYMQIYKRLYDTHRLNMRVRGSFTLKDLTEPAKTLIDRAIRFRTKWAVDPEFLRADAVKIFADGVIEYPSQTAALIEPYLDAQGHPTTNRGPSYYTQDNLNRIVGAADAAGFTVHIHAIGDRAVRGALDAFAYSRQLHGQLDNRDQIAHLELIEPEDFPRFRQLGVIANFQLLWAQRDSYIQETLQYLGPQRSKYLYPAGSLKRAGALIAGGSDWSVSSFNAFEAMEHAITRSEGRGKEPLLPDEAIGLQYVVDAYTINAAFALKQERTTGSLEPGKRGDFIVLDRDIFVIDPFNLHETRVLATYLDGREVYSGGTLK